LLITVHIDYFCISLYFPRHDWRCLSHVGFLCEFDLSQLRSLGHHMLILDAHNSTSPSSSVALVFIELLFEVLCEHIQVLEIFFLDFSESKAGSSLLVDNLAESCLSLNEAIRNTLLSAESGQEDQEFYWVNIVSHHDQFSFA